MKTIISCNHIALLLLMVVLMTLPAGRAMAGDWGPWSANSSAPALFSRADRYTGAPDRHNRIHPIAATPFLWLVRFYQATITHVDGDRCPMYPTCSQYSVQAFRKHGPVIGIILSADRLIHEADEQRYARIIRVGNRYRYDDPVEANDFWWAAPR